MKQCMWIVLLILIWTFISCASQNPGNYGKTKRTYTDYWDNHDKDWWKG